MDKAMKDFLKTIPNFESAYYKAKEYVQENINPYCDALELSENTHCDICFPITDDNLYIIGLDIKQLTIWIFYDSNLANAD